MVTSRTALKPILLACLASGFVACAAVADIGVTNETPEAGGPGQAEKVDNDDPNRPADAAGDAAADAASDTGLAADAADAKPAPAPSICSCPMEQGCCANVGSHACTPVSGADACRNTNNGLFLRCSGSDVANGRTCCFTSDHKETFYGSSCTDAGAQVCSGQADCEKGTCTMVTCRDVSLQVCVPNGENVPGVCL